MSELELENKTAFTVAPVFLTDENGRHVLVLAAKASYEIDKQNKLGLAEKQAALRFAGEFWGEPNQSSYKYEPETALMKLGTDIALVGHVHAQQARQTSIDVAIEVGPLRKTARVVGDRFWVRRLGKAHATKPGLIDRVPLTWERAYGGMERRADGVERVRMERRNPVGRGFVVDWEMPEERRLLPNVEDPRQPKTPCGFGFIGPNWEPRVAFGGTYDEEWMRDRMPLLPKDFDRRFFNAASPDLVAPGYLRGDETVRVTNIAESGDMAFRLPGVPPPLCRVGMRKRADEAREMKLDTVIVNTDDRMVFLIWRAHVELGPGSPRDVHFAEVSTRGGAEEAV